MLDMSFYNNTMNKEKLKEFIRETNKPIRYTYGFKWKNPTTLNVRKTKEQAIKIVDSASMLDATELVDVLDLNAFGGNDMW